MRRSPHADFLRLQVGYKVFVLHIGRVPRLEAKARGLFPLAIFRLILFPAQALKAQKQCNSSQPAI